jgi:hydrogenase maturation factor
MRIVGLLGDGLARCADDSGSESDVMVDLIHPVRVGARIVVHAGTALRVTESPEALP